MTAERIAALEAQLAAAQATIRDQARALEENARRERERDALRIEQERETERQRILRRERNARHRAARRQGDASETLVRRSGDVSETSHPSFSSPPLDGPPLSSQTQLSPPLYPLPASSFPSSGLADASPPVSDNSADDLPQADPEDVLEEAGGVESGPIPPLDSPIPHSASLPGQGANPSGSPNGSNHPAKPESSKPPANSGRSSTSGPPGWPPALRLEVQAAPKATRTRKPSAAERLYAQLEATRKARCEERGVAFVAEDWAPARQNTNLGRFAQLEPAEQERFEAAWAEYLSDDAGAVRNPPWSLGWFLASKSTWESKALRGAS